MPYSTGDKVGPYEITGLIGKGGMGEVYKARDPRLNRDVAIKVSKDQFSERFEREARAVAALNHPNVCTLYDVGPNYLVMEFVEGVPPKGPLPLDETLRIAHQVADALEAAHEKNITHRDLKPGNILIRPDGMVKVLDFGLAKIAPNRDHEGADATVTLGATQAGSVLGTPAYMSPEQAKGKTNIDKRADIWAFGVVLYELLTGQRLFSGNDLTEVLAAVVLKEPELSAAPPQLRRLLRKCLEKDPAKRLRDIGDVWELMESGTEVPLQAKARATSLPWIATAAAVVIALIAFWAPWRTAPEPQLRKVAILAPENATFDPGGVPQVSPDGRYVAFKATVNGMTGLWVRDPDSLTPRLLPGTIGVNLPFWSPDSKSLGFFADGKLKRIDIAGGPAITLCDAGGGQGGSWSANGVIVFTPGNSHLFWVPAAGGMATPLTTIDQTRGEIYHRSPWFLPDGRHFLYTAVSSDAANSRVYVGDVEAPADSNPREVLAANSNTVYAWPGYLLYVRDRTLMAQPFDAGSAQITGDAVPVAERVDYLATAGLAQFSASQTGVLAYVSGGATGGNIQLTWVDRVGKPQGTVGAPGEMEAPAISPDGNSIAMERTDPQTRLWDIWRYDLRRGSESRFTFGDARYPVWSPDGAKIAFGGFAPTTLGVYQKAVNGSAQDEIVVKDDFRLFDWSHDGQYLIVRGGDQQTLEDIWIIPISGEKPGDKKPSVYLNTKAREGFAKLSPNGKWLAYTSDESRQNEVYVGTFPTPGGKWQVSTRGGSRPIWSRDGNELYFIGADQKMMAVKIKDGATFDWEAPQPLFDVPLALPVWYDVHPDGRFLIPMPLNQTVTTPITLMLDWPAVLKR